MSGDTFADTWGRSELIRVPVDLLTAVELRDSDAEFLALIGLPAGAEIPGLTDQIKPLPYVPVPGPAESVTGGRSILSLYPASSLRLLAYVDYRPFFGIQSYVSIRPKDGAIWLVDQKNPSGLILNSSLHQWVESLLAAREFLRIAPAEFERNTNRHIQNLKGELKRIDNAAFGTRGSCWAVWVQELKNLC
ncbi:MAG: SUKH-4 family immunity protein [Fimbriimonas sp.]|nr:SUKH-4 family immunity protein [Fimbriimonas sp.]